MEKKEIANKKHRVLFVVRYLWGDEGISVCLVRLAQGLQKRGWEVGLASAMKEDEPQPGSTRGVSYFESQGIKHFFVPFPDTKTGFKNPVVMIKALVKLNRVAKNFSPDIIHLHSLSMCPYLNVIRFLHKIPFISTAHLEPTLDSSFIKVSAKISQYFPHFLGNHFIAISTELKNIYEQYVNLPSSQITLINHGFDTQYFRPPSVEEKKAARNFFNLSENQPTVCIIGRLDPIKGHHILFNAIARLKDQGINIITLCAGTGGDYKTQITALPSQIGVEDLVKFIGFSEARQVLWASDILVLPSQKEGFPLVISEAMLCGVTIIRTPTSGVIDQTQDGVNGFIIPFNNSEILASRLKQLFNDEKLKSQITQNALNYARGKFTQKVMTDLTINVYAKIISM